MSGFERTGPEAAGDQQAAPEFARAGQATEEERKLFQYNPKAVTTSPGRKVEVNHSETVFAETLLRASGNNLVVTIPILAASQAGIKAGDRIAVVYSPVGDVILRKTQNE